MVNPFVINPDHASYVHQFEWCRGDQPRTDSLSLATTTRRDAASHTPKSTLFQPYNKTSPRMNSFRPFLCIRCRAAGHKASECQATSLTVLNKRIVVDWKANRLVSKTGQLICLMFKEPALTPNLPHMVLTPAPSVATNNTLPAAACGTDLDEVLYIHTTPYNADGWSAALTLCNLTSDFPNLVHDIKFGSPIGNPPPLLTTFLPRNLPSTDLFPNIIDHELLEETAGNRMSGPFTEDEARYIFNGHFRTSPVGLVEKYPGDGKWRMIRHLSKTDSDGFSMNQWLDSTDFPTVFYLAATIASYVSPLLIAHLTNAGCLLFPAVSPFT